MDILGSLKGKCLLFYGAQLIWFCCAWYKFCLIFLMRLGDNTNQRSLNTQNTDSVFSTKQEIMSNYLLYVICTHKNIITHHEDTWDTNPPWQQWSLLCKVHRSSNTESENQNQGLYWHKIGKCQVLFSLIVFLLFLPQNS